MVSKFEVFNVLSDIDHPLTAAQIAEKLRKPVSQVRRALRRYEFGFRDKGAPHPLRKVARPRTDGSQKGPNVVGWTLVRNERKA